MRIKSGYVLVFSVIFLVAIALVIVYLANDRPDIQKVCYDDNCFHVELAVTMTERAEGLMWRQWLDEDEGMLFIYDVEQPRKFWMKNTIIPLDMLWLSEDGEVLYIEHNAQPCEQEPCPLYGEELPAQYVFEINGKMADEIGIEVGDKLRFE